MKRALFISVTLFFILLGNVFSQDTPPTPAITFKQLQTPNNAVFWYNPVDSFVWVYKGQYGWTRLLGETRAAYKYVPYNGATKDVNLGVHGITANDMTTNSLQIVTTATPTTSAPGLIQWNAVDGTYDMGLLNSSILQVGQETMFYGKAVGSIANGDLCQFAGVHGDHILIKKAVGSEIEANPHFLIGVATENIVNGVFGYVTWFGKINGIYTNTPNNQDSQNWIAGDILYFNNITGQLTKTMPSPPNRVITVAAVIKVQTGASESGIIIVRPQSGHKLAELDDVNGTPLTQSGQFPVWDNTNKYFDFTDNISNYWSKTEITPTDTTRWGISGGGTQSQTFSQAYLNEADITSSTISVTFPASFPHVNYALNLRAWYSGTVNNKSVQIAHAIYDFTKTISGFSFKVDTVAGRYSYFAADTTVIFSSQDDRTKIVNEVPAGLINGVNTAFTLAKVPNLNTQQLYMNGVRLTPTVDYIIASNNITINNPPLTGYSLLVDYSIGEIITNEYYNEIPSGAINGINTIFTFVHSVSGTDISLFLNGVRQRNGIDFTISGNEITFIIAPATGYSILADYKN